MDINKITNQFDEWGISSRTKKNWINGSEFTPRPLTPSEGLEVNIRFSEVKWAILLYWLLLMKHRYFQLINNRNREIFSIIDGVRQKLRNIQISRNMCVCPYLWKYDDVIKWKHFPRYCPFVRGIHRSPVISPHKGQWRGALMFSLICVWINGWVNDRDAGDLRRYRAHYDGIVMFSRFHSYIFVAARGAKHFEHCDVTQTLLLRRNNRLWRHLVYHLITSTSW